MNLEAMKRNAENTIAKQKELAANGEDFSMAMIMDSERVIKLVDEIVPQITDEEWERLNAGTPGIRVDDVSGFKDIKEKYGLSWKELKSLRWQGVRKNSEAKIRANDRYNKTHTKNVAVRFNINTDADIIAHLETVENKSEYFKRLIREDMAK